MPPKKQVGKKTTKKKSPVSKKVSPKKASPDSIDYSSDDSDFEGSYHSSNSKGSGSLESFAEELEEMLVGSPKKKASPKKASPKPKKPRKILRDNIQGLTKPSLMRLIKVAGCARASGLVYEELRGMIKVELEHSLEKIATIVEGSRKKTLTFEALKFYADGEGEKLYTSAKSTFSQCKNAEDMKSERLEDCLFIGKLPFKRLVKEIVQDFGEFNLSAGFTDNYQYYIERKMINLIRNACRIGKEIAKRETLFPEDLRAVRKYGCKTISGARAVGKRPETAPGMLAKPVQKRKKKTTKKKVSE
jgi:histone H3/H4